MPDPDGLIPRPRGRPSSLFVGDDCLQRQMRTSSKGLARFRDLMHRSIARHLDLRVTRMWKDAHKRTRRPEVMYEQAGDGGGSEADTGSDPTPNSDDDNQGNSARRSKKRVDKPPSKDSRPAPAQDSGRGQAGPRPGPSQSSQSNTQASNAAASHPSDRRGPEAPDKPNDGFAAVTRFLRSLTPSLEHVAVQFSAAGVKDAQRLRVVAGWETRKQRKWLVRGLRVNAFEEEVLQEALDEIRRGVRNV
ncbi:uncharacterized protein B0H18DRAFT_1121310 [Fomitopsis serialis]|uniref:uncharacterized protein n=1 Tax=Fomitopsis serialis TaxID=139415 RepID=UPI002007B812|nr:uncharacterized protein B0H18DRAFT_1121310 [Neoantrodia serialis]KAH9921616.1 hypothetical protein B0H18DRAFT_1121310 [Neoantrodia serialis]